MPTYEYHCKNCSHKLEAFQKITDAPLTLCTSCQKETLQRGPGGGIGLAFKGSGFYITDYAKGKSSDNPACCPCAKDKSSCNKPSAA